jgi:hypothetical protein
MYTRGGSNCYVVYASPKGGVCGAVYASPKRGVWVELTAVNYNIVELYCGTWVNRPVRMTCTQVVAQIDMLSMQVPREECVYLTAVNYN